MPMILAEAWNKQLVIISNNPGHVSKGALFSLYPDNTGLGESLAELAKTTATTQRDNVSLLRNVQSAVNIRTAEHLGIHFNNQDKRSFSLLFPSR